MTMSPMYPKRTPGQKAQHCAIYYPALDGPVQTGGSHRSDNAIQRSFWRARQMGRRQMTPTRYF